ncbi:MAG: dihydrodipicolinate synthase family protein [Gemmatimonadaceae bacterium]
MIRQLRGVFAPVVSTFHATTGELDVAAFAANGAAHLALGMDGLVVTGSTGEAALLDQTERSALIDAARAVVPADKLLLVGTGAESTRTCLAQTRDAAKRGADAALVVSPHYYTSAMTIDALRTHYRRVADESPVPVVLYSIPKYMHFAIPAELVMELAQHENVIGIKDSSGQRELLAAYMPAQSDTFSVLTGNAQLFQHSMQSGARGGILAGALFAGGLALDIYRAVLTRDESTANAAHARFSPLGARIVGELGVPGVKAAMDGVGLHGGPVRSPLQAVSAETRASIDELLKSAELATA